MTISIPGVGEGFSLRSLQRQNQAKEDSSRTIATGKRITRAADDAAGLAIAQRFLADERSAAQGARNLNDGISVAQTAEAALSTTSDNLLRLRELTVQAQNGTLSEQDRAVIQQEYDQVAAEITRTAESTQFNGRTLLNGDLEGSGVITLADGTGGEQVRVEVEDQSAAALGVEGLSVSDPATVAAIDQAIDGVSASRADLGSAWNRIEHGLRSLQAAAESSAAARSRIEDADYAAATATATKNRILADGQIALAAQANASTASALELLA